MRLYNKYYRQSNPPKGRTTLKGEKKGIYEDLLTLLSASVLKRGQGRTQNPKGMSAEDRRDMEEYFKSVRAAQKKRRISYGKEGGRLTSVDAFNMLGDLNRKIEGGRTDLSDYRDAVAKSMKGELDQATRDYLKKLDVRIAEGRKSLIPLRDTINAAVEGYFDREALEYNLHDAIQHLGSTQARVVRRMIDDVGGQVTPREHAGILVSSRKDPSVLEAQKHVATARKYQEAFVDSIRRSQLSQAEWALGEEYAKEQSAADAKSKKLWSQWDGYSPQNKKLWNEVKQRLQKKYKHHLFDDVQFVPATVDSVIQDEFKLLVTMRHGDTPIKKRQNIKRRLQASLKNRWDTKIIQAYEAAGGEEMTPHQKKVRKEQKERKFGVPFPFGDGIFGLYRKRKDGGIRWFLIGEDSTVFMHDDESNKNSASRSLTVAHRVLMNALNLTGRAGWDDLPDEDVQWLKKHKPTISKSLARIFAANIGGARRVDNDTKRWLIAAAELDKAQAEPKRPKQKVDMVALCEALKPGEAASIPEPNGRYVIHVKKARGEKPYQYYVETTRGSKSVMRRAASCDLLALAHIAAEKMIAKEKKKEKTVANPSRRTHKTCKGMKIGEERVFTNKKREYLIHVKKGRGKKTPYSYCVEMPDGSKSSTRKTADCSDVISRGHVIGGAMVGAMRVAQAANNPAKLKQLEGQARRGMAKTNPRQRIVAKEGDIAEMRGVYQLPDHPEEAAKYGYYMGIIKGIDTCGVQNYMKRRRIRKAYQDRLAEGEQEFAAGFSGTKVPKLKKHGGIKMPKFITRTLSGDGDDDELIDEEEYEEAEQG